MAAESEESLALHLSLTSSTPTTSSLDCSSPNVLTQRTKSLSGLLPNGKKTKGKFLLMIFINRLFIYDYNLLQVCTKYELYKNS